jgi:hypothetical protein
MTPAIFAHKLMRELPGVIPLSATHFWSCTPVGRAETIVSQLRDGRIRVIAFTAGHRDEPEIYYTQLRLDLDPERIARDIVRMIWVTKNRDLYE